MLKVISLTAPSGWLAVVNERGEDSIQSGAKLNVERLDSQAGRCILNGPKTATRTPWIVDPCSSHFLAAIRNAKADIVLV